MHVLEGVADDVVLDTLLALVMVLAFLIDVVGDERGRLTWEEVLFVQQQRRW
jgi:hypothetical protein